MIEAAGAAAAATGDDWWGVADGGGSRDCGEGDRESSVLRRFQLGNNNDDDAFWLFDDDDAFWLFFSSSFPTTNMSSLFFEGSWDADGCCNSNMEKGLDALDFRLGNALGFLVGLPPPPWVLEYQNDKEEREELWLLLLWNNILAAWEEEVDRAECRRGCFCLGFCGAGVGAGNRDGTVPSSSGRSFVRLPVPLPPFLGVVVVVGVVVRKLAKTL
ncbi:hypothetical protein ACA910_018839 [Epithemia clementina (nom. ined.)]